MPIVAMAHISLRIFIFNRSEENYSGGSIEYLAMKMMNSVGNLRALEETRFLSGWTEMLPTTRTKTRTLHLNHADTRHSSERLLVAMLSIIAYATKDSWKCLLSSSPCSLSGSDLIQCASSSMFTHPREFNGDFIQN